MPVCCLCVCFQNTHSFVPSQIAVINAAMQIAQKHDFANLVRATDSE